MNFRDLILGETPPHLDRTLEETDLADWEDPVAAVYILWAGDECLYVGQTRHLRARLRAHRKDKEFDRCEIYSVGDVSDRLRLETILIMVLRPRLNRGLCLGICGDEVWEVRWRRQPGHAGSRRAARRGD